MFSFLSLPSLFFSIQCNFLHCSLFKEMHLSRQSISFASILLMNILYPHTNYYALFVLYSVLVYMRHYTVISGLCSDTPLHRVKFWMCVWFCLVGFGF